MYFPNNILCVSVKEYYVFQNTIISIEKPHKLCYFTQSGFTLWLLYVYYFSEIHNMCFTEIHSMLFDNT